MPRRSRSNRWQPRQKKGRETGAPIAHDARPQFQQAHAAACGRVLRLTHVHDESASRLGAQCRIARIDDEVGLCKVGGRQRLHAGDLPFFAGEIDIGAELQGALRAHLDAYGKPTLIRASSSRATLRTRASIECCAFPRARGVGRALVSVLTQPPKSMREPHISASCHAPCGMASTPGMMRGVTRAAMTNAPLSFSTSSISPDCTSSRRASSTLIHITWGATSSSSRTPPNDECVRCRQW